MRSLRNRYAHIIGVVVSEMTMETRMAVDSVTANSRNSRPTIPPISSSGMNTAISEMLMVRTVKPISLAPCKVAAKASIPASRWRVMFSITTMASSTTKPGRNGESHQRKIVQAVAAEVHHRECADQRHGNGHRGNKRGAAIPQKDEDHDDYEPDGKQQRALHVVYRRADGGSAIENDRGVNPLGNRRFDGRQLRANAIDGVDDIGARLAEHDKHDGAFAVQVTSGAHVLYRVDYIGDVLKMDGCAIFVADDDRFVILGVGNLVVGENVGARDAVGDLPFGEIGVLQAQHGLQMSTWPGRSSRVLWD